MPNSNSECEFIFRIYIRAWDAQVKNGGELHDRDLRHRGAAGGPSGLAASGSRGWPIKRHSARHLVRNYHNKSLRSFYGSSLARLSRGFFSSHDSGRLEIQDRKRDDAWNPCSSRFRHRFEYGRLRDPAVEDSCGGAVTRRAAPLSWAFSGVPPDRKRHIARMTAVPCNIILIQNWANHPMQ